MNHLRLDTSRSDRLTIWIDVAGRSVNVLFEAVFDELRSILSELKRRGQRSILVLRSGKPAGQGFVVGADLRRIVAINSEPEIQHFLLAGQRALEELEQFDGDTVAFINGPCLGGGLELALACRYRIACDTPRTQLGMPEAKLGLMPGWGGTQRVIETVGVERGLHMLLTGDPIDAQRALEIGLVDARVEQPTSEEQIAGFIGSLPQTASTPPHGRQATAATGEPPASEQLTNWKRRHAEEFSPAQEAILQAVAAGVEQSREAGFRAERELFYPLLVSPLARDSLRRFAERPHGP